MLFFKNVKLMFWSAGSGGSIPPAGGKRAPSGGSGAKPPKKKLPYKSIL
jgi:hypothetical protein